MGYKPIELPTAPPRTLGTFEVLSAICANGPDNGFVTDA